MGLLFRESQVLACCYVLLGDDLYRGIVRMQRAREPRYQFINIGLLYMEWQFQNISRQQRKE